MLLGKSWNRREKKEGDKITPKGIFKITGIYYRADRIKNIITSIKKIKITKARSIGIKSWVYKK